MNREIVWNIVNSLLAGALVFLGALSDGEITFKTLIFATIIFFTVAITQFKNYWTAGLKDYSTPKLFNFVKI